MLLGAILICLVWVTLFFFLKNEHDSAERAAIQNSTNLAGAFEEHLSRSISELDRSLKIIRALQARDRGRFDLVDWLRSNRILTDEVLQITIVDRDGKVTLGSFESAARTASDPRDSEYYRTHINASNDQLAIGKPVIDPAMGGWVLQLSRRIENDDRSFNGVIVATLDPAYLMRIYNSVNIGEHGYIRVVGLDGSVRATSGRETSVLGQDFSSSDLFKRVSEAPNGWFYTGSFLSDNLSRLIAYRSVKDYPLIISVGFASHEIFSRLEALRQSGYLAAAVLTLLILIVTGLSVRGQWLRERAKKHMEHANMLLNAA
jgi:hypothetical protein